MLKAPNPLSLARLAQEMVGVSVSIQGDPETQVTGLTEDSRAIEPGGLFVARRGQKFAAERFIPDAIRAGARAILCEPSTPPFGLPAIVSDDVQGAFGRAAQALAGHPSRRLRTVGITGTNGKTTTLTLVAQALGILGHSVATLGTLGFAMDGQPLSDTLTTPQPDTLAAAMLTAVQRGAQFCVMEVSSHALSQKRVWGVEFEVAAFSNLSQDHLDFHGTMDDYAAAKARLFELAPQHRVINVDDPFGARLAKRHPGALCVGQREGSPVDLCLRDASIDRLGMTGRVTFGGQTSPLKSPLVGHHNADNLLLALGILLSLGVPLDSATQALGQVKGAAGRLERCDGDEDDVMCVVDYAHTPDALRNVLEAARRLAPSQVICVFGCGGDRDRSKRPLMGEMAAQHADLIWVTSDNPRSESPVTILDEIRPGLVDAQGRVTEELDRRAAISQAILQAPPGSLVAICGKGHETYQLVGDQVLPFDDRLEARLALAKRRGSRGRDS